MTEKTCAKSYILCHSQATCEDFDDKFCCICRKGFFGNGFSCLKEGDNDARKFQYICRLYSIFKYILIYYRSSCQSNW